jgi:hypothetical protein
MSVRSLVVNFWVTLVNCPQNPSLCFAVMLAPSLSIVCWNLPFCPSGIHVAMQNSHDRGYPAEMQTYYLDGPVPYYWFDNGNTCHTRNRSMYHRVQFMWLMKIIFHFSTISTRVLRRICQAFKIVTALQLGIPTTRGHYY